MSARLKVPSIVFGALSIGYPLLVYFGLLHFSARSVALCLALLLAVRLLWVLQIEKQVSNNKPIFFALALAILCALVSIVLNHTGALRLIPTVISSTFLLAFASTLWRPPSMIERFSRIGNPNPTPKIIAYTRSVTIVWCLFFLFNGLIALYTALYASMEVWTLYNGLISYILMGVLFATEYTIRLRVKAQDAASKSIAV